MASNPIRFDEQFTLEQFQEARLSVLGEGAALLPPPRIVSRKVRYASWGAGIAAFAGAAFLLGGAPVAGRAITAHEHATPSAKEAPAAPPQQPGVTPRSEAPAARVAVAIMPVYHLTSEAAHRLPLSETAPSF